MTAPAHEEIKLVSREIEQKGIWLPWERWSTPAVFKDGVNLTPERPHPSVKEDGGIIFIPLDKLYELADQDRWDSQFGSALLLGPREGLALVAAGLAEQETRGGYHRTDALTKLMTQWEEEGRA